MRKAITIAALLALLAVPFFAVAAESENRGYKIDICHADGGGRYRLLNVDVAASESGGWPQGHGGHLGDSWESQDNDGTDHDVEARGDFPGGCAEEPELTSTFWGRQNCTGWGLMQQNFIDGDPDGDAFVRQQGVWELPYELETKEFPTVKVTILEPEECLLTEGTPTPPPHDCNVDGDGICPGDDDDPEEHPATGGEIDAGLAVVTALSGLTLAGIGGSILLFMKRRASR